jgi:hypothetical protein
MIAPSPELLPKVCRLLGLEANGPALAAMPRIR